MRLFSLGKLKSCRPFSLLTPRRWSGVLQNIQFDAIPQHYLDVSHEKLFSGQLPTGLVIRLVTNQAFNGHVESNPFNFQHFNLNELAL